MIRGPRGMGKSSAIVVAGERARAEGVLVVHADVATASGLVDVANRLLQSLSGQRPRERLLEFAAGIAPHVMLTFDDVSGVPRLVFGAERRRVSAERQRRTLEEVIEGLAGEVGRAETRVAVVLDEFQAVRRLGGEAAEWHLRDVMQRHGEVSFICAGSEVALVQDLLEAERAFHRLFELLYVEPMDAHHLAAWIESRLGAVGAEADGVGGAIVEAAGPRTQDILQVARHVYVLGLGRGGVGTGDVGTAVDDVVREEDPVIRATWQGLTAHQQNVLRAVAAGTHQVYGAAARDRFSLPTSSTVAVAVNALVSRVLLARGAPGVRFDSPFVRRWVELEALGDVPPEM